jgi:hypothetical protein
MYRAEHMPGAGGWRVSDLMRYEYFFFGENVGSMSLGMKLGTKRGSGQMLLRKFRWLMGFWTGSCAKLRIRSGS